MPTTTFQEFYSRFDVAIRAGSDEATMAGLRKTAEILPYVLIPIVVVVGIMLALGLFDKGKLFSYSGRIAIVIWLAVSQAFVPIVRDNITDGIPNEIATAINGDGRNITAVEQFDRIDQASGHFTSRVLGQATGFSQIGNKVAAWTARGFQKFWLAASFIIWMGVRLITHIAVAVMAFMLIFFIAKSTAQWALEQLAKLVGLVMWQLAMSILMKVTLSGTEIFLRDTLARGAGMSIEQQVDQCFDIAGWYFCCFILILMVPAIIGVGGGAAASSFVASGALINAGRTMQSAGNRLAAAANSMGRSARRMAGNAANRARGRP